MTTREFVKTLKEEDGKKFIKEKLTNEEVYKIFVERGLTDSYDVFLSEFEKAVEEKFSQMSRDEIMSKLEGAELSEEELEQIAGGKGAEEKETLDTDEAIMLSFKASAAVLMISAFGSAGF